MVGDRVQLVAHVSSGIEMNATGDEGDDHEHHHRERIDVPTDGELEVSGFVSSLVERVPIARIRNRPGSNGLSRSIRRVLRLCMRIMRIMRIRGMQIMRGHLHRMRFEPDSKRRQGEQQRRHDCNRRHPGGVLALRAHARSKKKDRHK